MHLVRQRQYHLDTPVCLVFLALLFDQQILVPQYFLDCRPDLVCLVRLDFLGSLYRLLILDCQRYPERLDIL